MKWSISMGVAVFLPTLSLFVLAPTISCKSCVVERPKPLQSAGQQPKANVADGLQLSVQVTDVEHTEGELLIGVFSQDDGFPREIQKALVIAKIKPEQPIHTFKNLPRGNYAVVVIHDRNNSGQLDRNLIGMPTEPVGLSNYPSIGLSKPPTFRNAAFELKESELLKVKLNPF